MHFLFAACKLSFTFNFTKLFFRMPWRIVFVTSEASRVKIIGESLHESVDYGLVMSRKKRIVTLFWPIVLGTFPRTELGSWSRAFSCCRQMDDHFLISFSVANVPEKWYTNRKHWYLVLTLINQDINFCSSVTFCAHSIGFLLPLNYYCDRRAMRL